MVILNGLALTIPLKEKFMFHKKGIYLFVCFYKSIHLLFMHLVPTKQRRSMLQIFSLQSFHCFALLHAFGHNCSNFIVHLQTFRK